MADSFVSKLITELTAKTTAADTDLVPVADSNGNFFKMTWKKMKQLLLGTKDISSVGDGTVTGAISELNTKMAIEDIPVHVSNVIVRSSYRIPALKLCFISMWIDRNLIGINNHIVTLDDVIASRTVWAPACGYASSGNIGKTGEIYINAGTNQIMCSSTSNTTGDMEAFIVIPYQ